MDSFVVTFVANPADAKTGLCYAYETGDFLHDGAPVRFPYAGADSGLDDLVHRHFEESAAIVRDTISAPEFARNHRCRVEEQEDGRIKVTTRRECIFVDVASARVCPDPMTQERRMYLCVATLFEAHDLHKYFKLKQILD